MHINETRADFQQGAEEKAITPMTSEDVLLSHIPYGSEGSAFG
jgi:hypothetical protein